MPSTVYKTRAGVSSIAGCLPSIRISFGDVAAADTVNAARHAFCLNACTSSQRLSLHLHFFSLLSEEAKGCRSWLEVCSQSCKQLQSTVLGRKARRWLTSEGRRRLAALSLMVLVEAIKVCIVASTTRDFNDPEESEGYSARLRKGGYEMLREKIRGCGRGGQDEAGQLPGLGGQLPGGREHRNFSLAKVSPTEVCWFGIRAGSSRF